MRTVVAAVACLVALAPSVKAHPSLLIVQDETKKNAMILVGRGGLFVPLPVAAGSGASGPMDSDKADRVFIAFEADNNLEMIYPAKVLAVSSIAVTNITGDVLVAFLMEDGQGGYMFTYWAQKGDEYEPIGKTGSGSYTSGKVKDIVKKAQGNKVKF
jgi:hypothetical protein